jgi:hypothetical protein
VPDDELDQRLHRLLAARANEVETHLDGPTLRALSDSRPSVARRLAPPLLVAAAIVLLALTPTLFIRSGSHPHRQPPGVSVSVPIRPSSPTPTPTPSPSSTASTPTTPDTAPPTSAPTSPTSPSGLPLVSAPGTPAVSITPNPPDAQTSLPAILDTSPSTSKTG